MRTSTSSTSRDTLSAYADPDWKPGLLCIITSAGAYFGLCVAMYVMLSVSPWIAIALTVPTAGFLVRTFVMFHDCVHGSLLPSKRANSYVGTALGVLVLTAYRPWRYEHIGHHATAGNLDRRGVGDLETLTVAEYLARPWRGRLAYRLFRNPLVLFGFGPIFAMIIEPRLVRRGLPRQMRNSILWTNAALSVIVGSLCWWIGWEDFLIVWAPASLLAGSVGIWLFYVQHQFEGTYWQRQNDWTYAEAGLHGSSYLRLPATLRFFTANIGLHHVHHLNPRIPNYNLQSARHGHAMFADIPGISIQSGLRATKLKLWDEDAGQLVTFSQADHPASPTPH